MTNSNTTYKHFFKERKSIIEASLHLMREGRFQQSVMSEIAFHAKLSYSTALQFFPDRPTLAEEIKAHVVHEVHLVLRASLTASPPSKASFQNAFMTLYNYYLRNAGALTFIDQCSTILKDAESVYAFHQELNSPLEDFFKSLSISSHPQKAAAVSHSGIIALAKMALAQSLTLSKVELTALSNATWTTFGAT